MRSPSLSPVTVAVAIGLTLVAIGLATVTLFDTPAPSATASAPIAIQPTPTGSDPTIGPVAIDPSTCTLDQQPGPDDKVPKAGGEGTDVVDLGNGRWRLCLTEPESVIVEGSAWCTWTDDRRAVRDITGLRLDAGGNETVDGGVALDEPSVSLIFTTQDEHADGFQGGEGRQQFDGSADGRSGVVSFRLALFFDPEHPPAIRPADKVGTIRWACGDPPPSRPGRSTGRVRLHIDAPVDRTWNVAAACDWQTSPGGATLFRVESYPPDIAFNDRLVGVSISRYSHPDTVDASIWVDQHDAGDFYTSTQDDQLLIRAARNGGSGLLRVRHLRVGDGSEVRLVAGLDELSGVIEWTCPPPAVPGPAEEPAAPGEESETHPGHATIHLDPAVIEPADGAITCTIDRSGADPRIARLSGTFDVAGGRLELRSDGGWVLLAVIGADGQPGGEYTGQIREFSDDASLAGLMLRVDDLRFEPTDPRYRPLGGPEASRTLALRLDYTCDLESQVP